MNYAQNYKDVTKKPLQDLMKMEETSKKSSTASVDLLDKSNAQITIDKLNANSPNEVDQMNKNISDEADKYWNNALSSTKPA